MPNSLYFPYHYILVNIYNICSDSCVGFGQITCNLPIKFYQDILALFLGDRALGSGGEVEQDLFVVWCYSHTESSFTRGHEMTLYNEPKKWPKAAHTLFISVGVSWAVTMSHLEPSVNLGTS